MPPETKRKLTMVAAEVRMENPSTGPGKWALAASRDRAELAADTNGFTLQLMNLQNALSRANRPDR
jgi:hypothetical protein